MKLNTPLPPREPTVRMYTTKERARGFAKYVVLYSYSMGWEYDIPESLVQEAEAAGLRRM